MMVWHRITTLLTCPAALLRAFFEHILLKGMKIPVEDTDYLQKNELCGHVEHKPIRTFGKSFWHAFLPGFVLFILGLPMAVIPALEMFVSGNTLFNIRTGAVSVLFLLNVVLYYLGVSMLCNLFPSYEDALFLWDNMTKAKVLPKILLFLPTLVIRIGAFFARFGISKILAIAVTLFFIFI